MPCWDCIRENVECRHVQEAAEQNAAFDRDARQILEALELNSFENVINAFEEFLSNINFFDSPKSFAKAARALDIAAGAFAQIDDNHDFVMSQEELERYVSQASSPDNANVLAWLLANFSALERMSFFAGGITRTELEAARDLFHGLHHLQSHFAEISGTHGSGRRGISAEDLEAYRRSKRTSLDVHDMRGLTGLAIFLRRIHKILDRSLLPDAKQNQT